ncbi:hypothetical protein RUESEDTHA_00753 [Ruegeria sp. THAF57]|uniref:integrase catalytic domain-containing protein n=1 Tax=Ruegeria sp. THAF57 TaxID=2744555 RepID=UPI0015DEE64D|nr:hypothetical protein RUESEDTHA_00753 [Ruegeria sp. THAF57]
MPDGVNELWNLEIGSDAQMDGRRFLIVTLVDGRGRENLVLVGGKSLSGLRVTRELDRLIGQQGVPKTIVSDNGTEFISIAMFGWARVFFAGEFRRRRMGRKTLKEDLVLGLS